MSSAQPYLQPGELQPGEETAAPSVPQRDHPGPQPPDLTYTEHKQHDFPQSAIKQQTALKQQVADRLAAHRARRGEAPRVAGPAAIASTEPRGRTAHIAAAVAERYAHSQSYRAFLASEAERAVYQADAAAEVATISAQAIAVAQQRLLADLELWGTPSEMPTGPVAVPHVPLSPADYAGLFENQPEYSPVPLPGPVPRPAYSAIAAEPIRYTVRPYADAAHPVSLERNSAIAQNRFNSARGARHLDLNEGFDESFDLDDEIAFRHNPVFEEMSPQEVIAANLIEFPRQLVAARKARPRLAEGPLRDAEAAAARKSQLRIFEVESQDLSSAPTFDCAAPVWSSILLSALPAPEFTAADHTHYLTASIPQPAPIRRRVTAALVDASLILAAQAAFTAALVFALRHLSADPALLAIPRPIAVAGAAGTLAIFAVLYQLLFFTLSDATPGMRFARIALCTFADENPTRSALRRRIFATLLAATPLGLGLVWALLDEDTLGWHDRISHIYQRAY